MKQLGPGQAVDGAPTGNPTEPIPSAAPTGRGDEPTPTE
jgi:hypothetical protein